MIVYANTSDGFLDDVDRNRISDRIKEEWFKKTGKVKFSIKEDNSWVNSMEFMGKAIRRSKIPGDCGVMIEFGLPSTSWRIDFILSGHDAKGNKNFIIIELKQWKEAKSTSHPDLVLTPYYGGNHSTHPSYQAHSYKQWLSDFNENVYSNELKAYSCAYLHNYAEGDPEPLKKDIYNPVVSHAPIYFKDDYEKLESFLQKFVGSGKGKEILYKIESGNIKPSKKLIQHVTSLFKGNQEFILLEDQKVAYEIAFNKALNATNKTTIIISGGPGTGKSVISMSLLGGLLKKGRNTAFVAPNASFREVMVNKLGTEESVSRVKYLLKGSGAFYNARSNAFDVLVVDEAHRLKNERAFMYKGKNQVEDIISASLVNVFFIDEKQMIRPEDIGTVSEIKRVANLHNSEIVELKLKAQFRCSGAEGFMNWIDDVLQLEDNANYDGWDTKDFEFQIMNDPNEVRIKVNEKCDAGYSARMLAGYAWDWTSESKGNSDAQIKDIKIPEFNFEMAWNSRKVGTTWAINKTGLSQVGCVHTSQGLEFDFVGVIIGEDLKMKLETQEFYTAWDKYKDGKGKEGLAKKPNELSRLVRNIYRVLLTRGMKGCYVYCVDKEVEKYFLSRLGKNRET